MYSEVKYNLDPGLLSGTTVNYAPMSTANIPAYLVFNIPPGLQFAVMFFIL